MSEFLRPWKVIEHTPEEVQLIADLLARGREDAEVMQRVVAWTEAGEAEAERVGIEARVLFERRRASLYWRSGYRSDAEDTWDAAIEFARNENRDDLCDAIIRERTALTHHP
ncbi:hypothetical protein HY632_00140 [Candidatus Uhrbacteria bacterium]|nr:hypothetical protein [Candidatus Uhrbacteria bacterium]